MKDHPVFNSFERWGNFPILNPCSDPFALRPKMQDVPENMEPVVVTEMVQHSSLAAPILIVPKLNG